MPGRIIECQVNDEYVVGSGVPIGAAGSHDDVVLRLDFGDMWADLNIYATFRNALGGSPTIVLLTSEKLVDEKDMIYDVPVPATAKTYAGKAMLTLTGYEVDETGAQESSATNTATAYFTVLPSDYAFAEDGSITPTIAQQLQVAINAESAAREEADEAHDEDIGALKEDVAELENKVVETKEEIIEDIEGFLGEKTIFATKVGLKDSVAINGEVRYPSEGLEYVVNDDGTECAVAGIGTCTDINVVVPRTYNGVPVTSVLSNAFENASIDSINLFEGVTFIGAEAFKGSPIRFVYMYSTFPFEVGEDAFDDTVKGLFVPLHSVDAYKANEAWSVYADRIVAIETPESINTTIVTMVNNLSAVDAVLAQLINNLSQSDSALVQVDSNLQAQITNTNNVVVESNKSLQNQIVTLNGQMATKTQINSLQSQINEIAETLGTVGTISFMIVTELPTEDIAENAIYLLPSENAAEPNMFDEYIYTNGAWEQIGSAGVAVNLDEYVKKTDYASYSDSGVVKGNGGAQFRYFFQGGILYLQGATDAQIEDGTDYVGLTASNVDKIVQTGLTTNAIELTDEEKAAALEWLGAKAYVDAAIAAITDGEEVAY